MSLSPYFRSPFTDFSGAVISHQWYGRCADFELRALDCLEAYGMDKGVKKCESIINDFQECALRKKQDARTMAMRAERQRQFKAGERTKDDRFAESPKHDSY